MAKRCKRCGYETDDDAVLFCPKDGCGSLMYPKPGKLLIPLEERKEGKWLQQQKEGKRCKHMVAKNGGRVYKCEKIDKKIEKTDSPFVGSYIGICENCGLYEEPDTKSEPKECFIYVKWGGSKKLDEDIECYWRIYPSYDKMEKIEEIKKWVDNKFKENREDDKEVFIETFNEILKFLSSSKTKDIKEREILNILVRNGRKKGRLEKEMPTPLYFEPQFLDGLIKAGVLKKTGEKENPSYSLIVNLETGEEGAVETVKSDICSRYEKYCEERKQKFLITRDKVKLERKENYYNMKMLGIGQDMRAGYCEAFRTALNTALRRRGYGIEEYGVCYYNVYPKDTLLQICQYKDCNNVFPFSKEICPLCERLVKGKKILFGGGG